MRDLYLENSGINNPDKEKRKIKFDFILFFAVILISTVGVLVIYSATRYSMPGGVGDSMYYLKKQASWLGAAIIASVLIQFINYRVLKKCWWIFLIIIITSLALVLVIGYEVNGSKSWIDLKFFSIQPSEFSKVFMVIVVSAVLSKWSREKKNRVGFKKVSLSLIAALICIALVLLEPDFGTALIFFIVYIGILFLSGANLFYLFGILGAAVGGFFLALKMELIKQYQLDRILIFLKPEVQKGGIGYNLFQSKLAIGSGGLWGKGLFLGKQTNLNYVPQHHTDFIFSVIGEEFGFFGALFIIIIMTVVIWRCFYISANADNSFGSLLAGGIGFIILTQLVINIGMTIGIMPIIGIPLPFLSYGGSNLLSVFIGIGLVENVYSRRELRRKYEIAYQEFD